MNINSLCYFDIVEKGGYTIKTTVKKMVKAFVPYGLLKLYQQVPHKVDTIKEYENYCAALKDCSTQGSYENEELCQMIGHKTKNHIEYLKHSPYILNPTNVFLVSAIYNYLCKYSVTDLSILDFGGACGAHYFETRRLFLNKIKFKWIVCETEGMVESAKRHNIENDELSFVEKLDKVNIKIDFIHSSGTLQSVNDCFYYLSLLMNFDAKYMLFNRMMFNENDRTFITIQRSKLSENGPGLMPEKYQDQDKDMFYPHTTISYIKFNEFLQNKYDLKWCYEKTSGTRKINNENIIGRGLLYEKR